MIGCVLANVSSGAQWGGAGPEQHNVISYQAMKAPLQYIKERSVATHLVMAQIEADWTAPGFITPAAYGALVTNLNSQENLLADTEAGLALAAGEWDVALDVLHECSVCVTQVARGAFRGTDKLGAWRNVRANGNSREKITGAGRDVEAAWQAADVDWVPRTGLTLTDYRALQNTAFNKQAAYATADRNLNLERVTLGVRADDLYDLSVQWYLMATGAFPEGTINGDLIRTIPTQYQPSVLPGRLHFSQHFSPAPSQVELVWSASRGESYNIYAKSPGGSDFEKILDGVAQTSWVGQGLAAGSWAFQGEALNGTGTGEMSDIVIISVAVALAA